MHAGGCVRGREGINKVARNLHTHIHINIRTYVHAGGCVRGREGINKVARNGA